MGLLELTTGRVGLIGTVEQGTREEEVKNITEGASTNGGRRCTEPLWMEKGRSFCTEDAPEGGTSGVAVSSEIPEVDDSTEGGEAVWSNLEKWSQEDLGWAWFDWLE